MPDEETPRADRSRPGRDPLDALLDDRPAWRARLDEVLARLTDGSGHRWGAGSVAPRVIAVIAAVTALAVVAVMVGAVPGVGLRGSGSPSVSVALPRTSAGSARVPTTSFGAPLPGTAAPGIWVAAAGAVTRGGLYRLRSEARVSELLVAAGGLTPDADIDRLNLAEILRDGQRLYVPRRGEATLPTIVTGEGGTPGPTAGEPQGGTTGPSPERPVNVNTATAIELDALPGVGPATAAAIIAHRTTHGPFGTIDDLARVRGIGPAKLEQLRPLVTI